MARKTFGLYILANELLGLVIGCYAAEDGAVGAAAVVDGELQQFLALLHLLAVLDTNSLLGE